MSNTIIIKGLPDHMIRRILPEEVSDTGIAYAMIKTVLFMPTSDGGTFVVFDIKSEWNYITDKTSEDLFALMSKQ